MFLAALKHDSARQYIARRGCICSSVPNAYIPIRSLRSKRQLARRVQSPRPTPRETKVKDVIALPAFIRARDFAKKLKAPVEMVLQNVVTRRNRLLYMEVGNSTLEFRNVKEIILPYMLSRRVAMEIFGKQCEYEEVEPQIPDLERLHNNSHGIKLSLRDPVIALMGHVDHGKTTLMDALSSSSPIASMEREGITQKINLCEAQIAPNLKATFLDTPGHFHFFRMRTSAAQVADIVVLVVAADEGCLLQTEECIGCIEELHLPVVACINKIDKINEVYDKTIMRRVTEEIRSFVATRTCPIIPISAKRGDNLDSLKAALTEMVIDGRRRDPIFTRAYLNPTNDILPQGIVLESVDERGKGRTLKVLIKHGRVKKMDYFVSGMLCGVVKAIYNSNTKEIVNEGVPGRVVDVMYSRKSAYNDAPIEHGFFVLPKSKAFAVVQQRELKFDFEEKLASSPTNSHEPDNNAIDAEVLQSNETEKYIVLKADGAGSLAAIKDTVDDLSVITVRTGIGNISTLDIDVAVNQHCPIFGFNIRINRRERDLARQRNVKVVIKSTIHSLIQDIERFSKFSASD